MATTQPRDELARRRRIRRIVREVAGRLRTAPHVRERLQGLADGTVRLGRLMRNKAFSYRLPEVIEREIERLAGALAEVPDLLVDGAVTPSRIVRLALHEGLRVLRERYHVPAAAAPAPAPAPVPSTPAPPARPAAPRGKR